MLTAIFGWAWVVAIPVVLVLVWLGFSLLGYVLINQMHKSRVVPTSGDAIADCFEEASEKKVVNNQWLIENQFEPEGAYLPENMPGTRSILVWHIPESSTHLTLIFLADDRIGIYLSTVFDGFVVKTVNISDEHFVPAPPEVLVQTFTAKNATDLWPYHVEAVRFIEKQKRQSPVIWNDTFAELFAQDVQHMMRHLKTMPLWPLKFPYWVMFRRKKLHGKSIEDQSLT